MTSTAVRLHLQGRWQGVHPCGEALICSPFLQFVFGLPGVNAQIMRRSGSDDEMMR